MQIQFNKDKTIIFNSEQEEYFTIFIREKLSRFESNITRLEVHISDENGSKKGVNDIKCLIETRVEGKEPFVVHNEANSIRDAVSGSIEKVISSMSTIMNKLHKH